VSSNVRSATYNAIKEILQRYELRKYVWDLQKQQKLFHISKNLLLVSLFLIIDFTALSP
jgi:hypothetical protein